MDMYVVSREAMSHSATRIPETKESETNHEKNGQILRDCVLQGPALLPNGAMAASTLTLRDAKSCAPSHGRSARFPQE